MARRRKSSKRGGNSCCPVILVRCPRKSKMKSQLAGLGVTFPWERFWAGKSAESSAKAFEQAGPTKFERREALKKKGVMCTVRVGGHSRRVNLVNLRKVVQAAVKAQKRRRCMPLVKKG